MISDVGLWMIEIALIGGALGLLRPGRRQIRSRSRTPEPNGTTARELFDRVGRVAAAVLRAGGPERFDRARAELLEPPARPSGIDHPAQRRGA